MKNILNHTKYDRNRLNDSSKWLKLANSGNRKKQTRPRTVFAVRGRVRFKKICFKSGKLWAMKSFQLGKLALEGITVGTFLLRRIGFMCSHMDPLQRAVIHISRMVHAVVDWTLNAVILFLIHHFRSPPFAFRLFSRLPGDTMPAARMVLFCADSGKNMIGKTEKSGNKKSGNRKAGNRKAGKQK